MMLYPMYPIPKIKSLRKKCKKNEFNKPGMVSILFLYQLEYILPMFCHVMKNVHQQLIDEHEPWQLIPPFLHMNVPKNNSFFLSKRQIFFRHKNIPALMYSKQVELKFVHLQSMDQLDV